MPGPWIDAVTLKAKLTARLKVGALIPEWDDIIADAVQAGYSDLRTRLIKRGYTDAQLDNWDDRVRFNQDQALFWCFVNGAGLGGYSDQDYNKLDHRKELDDAGLGISIGGTITLPGLAGTEMGGSVIAGSLTVGTREVSGPSTFRTQADRREWWNRGRWNDYGPELG